VRPKSLSASSALVFESCPARWTAEYYLRGRGLSGSAADLGTAAHLALEWWVQYGHHTDPHSTVKTLLDLWKKAYDTYFPGDSSRYEEGAEMMVRWYERSHPLPHEVISTEEKQTFMLPTSVGEIPFNYIWDRCDRISPTEIEVVDYKSVSMPVQPEGLKDKIQARCYGLAAQLAHPEAERIWVTFDLLRFDPVGIVFTKEENRETWKYLRDLAERIIATDGNNAPERLNPECRWCIRKQVCGTLQKHSNVGGVLSITDPAEAAEKRLSLESLKGGIDAAIRELDEMILDHMEREELFEFETDNAVVKATTSRRRDVDSTMVGRIIGEELIAKYGSIGVGAIDKMIKAGEVTDAQADEIKKIIRYKHSSPSVKVAPKNPIGP
jgi:hypothetical protein